ncbi:hypothetical protein PFLUV_G00161190 [Perca fluviatilis]|uniref:Uncharacterized protein n=1 Tax=Perca fluviatilis TaxID=8168 RepID=A0A6A5F218_PERFL|nr:uncharacterized protein LOC120570961 [Perca fluviatilis]KAF1382124.1 hypothetical protein PFLUV_G00161190 [Perca fluviatilis]
MAQSGSVASADLPIEDDNEDASLAAKSAAKQLIVTTATKTEGSDAGAEMKSSSSSSDGADDGPRPSKVPKDGEEKDDREVEEGGRGGRGHAHAAGFVFTVVRERDDDRRRHGGGISLGSTQTQQGARSGPGGESRLRGNDDDGQATDFSSGFTDRAPLPCRKPELSDAIGSPLHPWTPDALSTNEVSSLEGGSTLAAGGR